MNFPHYRQQGQMDCGPTCLRMVCKHFGRSVAIQKLRALCFINRGGVNLLAISEAAEKIAFRTTGINKLLEAQKEWCKLTEIKSTPTLFLNGRRLPKTYQTEDLKYFI